MANTEQVNAIKESLATIVAIDPPTLGVSTALGAVNFKAGQPLFERVHKLAKELDALPMEALPTAGVNWQQLASFTANVATTLGSIAEFTLKGRANPESERDTLVTTLETQYDQMLNGFLPYIPYLTLRSAQVFEVVQQSQTLLADTKTTCDAAVTHLTTQKENIDTIVQAAKDAAAKIGVAKFAIKFDAIASDHEKLSKAWLITATVCGVVTLITSGVIVCLGPLWPTNTIPPDASVFPYVLTKLAFLSVLYFVTIWAGRNYKSHRHLGVLNRHRQNSLSTFETFVEASNDQKTKDAVLLEATRCIWARPGLLYVAVG